MGDLEKLEWVDAFSVVGYGARVGVRVSNPSIVPQLIARLSPGTRIGKAEGRVDRMLSVILGGPGERKGVRTMHMVYADHVAVGRSRDLETALESYDSHLRLAMAQFSRKKLFIHGGAVVWQGKAILFPGKSMAGKTHLVAELLTAGAEYLSDEYAVMDDQGMVHPFAKPLSIRKTPTARQCETPAEALGARIAKRPVPVGLVVMARYREGASWRPKLLSPAVGAPELMANTVAARMDPARTLAMLADIAERIPIVKSARPDAKLTVKNILRLASNY
ncbi:MAG: hypothetical protein ABI240_04855 [Sphingomonas sp.]